MNKKNFVEREDVQQLIEEIAGFHGMRVVKLLTNKAILDEFKISSSLKLEVNFVRSLLYKLYEKKIVSYTKERDNKKGWWIYSWKLHLDKIIETLIKKKKNEITHLENIKTEENRNQDFICESCGIKMNFGEAIENNFECFSCGMHLVGMEKNIDETMLNKKIGELYDEIKELEEFKKKREEKIIAKKKKEIKKLVGEKKAKKSAEKQSKTKKTAKKATAKKKAMKKAEKKTAKKSGTKKATAKKKAVKGATEKKAKQSSKKQSKAKKKTEKKTTEKKAKKAGEEKAVKKKELKKKKNLYYLR